MSVFVKRAALLGVIIQIWTDARGSSKLVH